MTYFLQALVIDSDNRESLRSIGATNAFAWITSEERESALNKASFLIEKDGWKVVEWIKVVQVTRDAFLGQDLGLKHFELAQTCTYSILYAGVDNSLETWELRELNIEYNFDKVEFFKREKITARKKMCMHFDAGIGCNEIIKAHSIQNKNSLSAISIDGHVYQVDMNKINQSHKFDYKLVGIKKASTFSGFCKKHDNSLFEQIDNHNLVPTHQQAFLYAYRSMTKELFTKYQAIERIQSIIDAATSSEAVTDYLTDMLTGNKYGAEQLAAHKKVYDESLKSSSYDDIRYVAFTFDEKPMVVFSGLIYPDYDFQGRVIQDIGRQPYLSLMTFCSAPTDEGWAFIFSWHKSSDIECYKFINSIQEVVRSGNNLGDFLFQLVILNCENHALSPNWWESLSQDKKSRLCKMMEKRADVFSEIKNDYLTNPPKGIIPWVLNRVDDSRPT